MRLDRYDNTHYDPGRPFWFRALWMVVSLLTISSCLPSSRMRVVFLRMFGARIGKKVVIKPYVTVKFPWHLTIGDNVWIGEKVWIDNLANVSIGANSCISQGAYLCTGSHNWKQPCFDLITRDINIEDQCWVGAMAQVAPGTCMSQGAVLSLGSVASGHLANWTIYGGNIAKQIKKRPKTDFDFL